jgi:hypothetical protein
VKFLVIRKVDGKLSIRGFGGNVKESTVVREGEQVLGEAVGSVTPNDAPFMIESEPGIWTVDQAARLEWKEKKEEDREREKAKVKVIFDGVKAIPDTIDSFEDADLAIQFLKRAILEIRKG